MSILGDLSAQTNLLKGHATWNGLKVVITDHALADDGWNFRPSRNRSARIHKKLMKRFGSMSKRVPSSYQMGSTLFIHPAMWEKLLSRVQLTNVPDMTWNKWGGGVPIYGALPLELASSIFDFTAT